MFVLSSIFGVLASAVAAQQAYNQILNPGANSVIQAGGGVQSITWTNLTSGNVSLALYSGSNPVTTVAPLTDSVVNTGTYLWTPETWLPSGNDYTIGVTDLSGSAPVQYSPFFTVQLCSTCSSSTRSTTSSFSVETVSVSGLVIGTRTDAAFPTQAALAASASGAQVSTGVANTASAAVASGSARQGASGVSNALPAVASQASALGASQDAILSMTGSLASAATSAIAATTSTTKSSSASSIVFTGFSACLLFAIALL